MPAAYSIDLRKRVIKLYATGEHTQQDITDLLDISLSTVKMYLRLERAGKDLNPGQSSGRTPILNFNDLEFLKELVKSHADATLSWFCEQVEIKTNKEVSVPTMHRILISLGFTRKKKVYTPRSKTEQTFK